MKLNLKSDDSTKASEKLVITKTTVFSSEEKNPGDWEIFGDGAGNITATHRYTRKLFEGTTADFNKLLKE